MCHCEKPWLKRRSAAVGIGLVMIAVSSTDGQQPAGGTITETPNAALRFAADFRDFDNWYKIPSEGYCDQPYIVVTKDGNWLCTMTTGPGKEGQAGQHVVACISGDQGQTWSRLTDIEPSTGPAASWVVPLVTPGGRVYAFYTYNGDQVETLRGKKIRADTYGWYVYKYSDDHGRTWSAQRYRLPLRITACDRTNDWQGKVQIFWGIHKPIVVGQSVCFSFTKLGRYMLDEGEGWLWRSDNILSEPNVGKLQWELLPEGDHGIRAPEFGSIQEEHNLVPLSHGDLYCMYRTTMGHPCHAYSRDGGRTWSRPEFATYTPGGRKIRQPRACPMTWRTQNGRFLFWYHNNGHQSFASGKSATSRNIAWLAGGSEKDGYLHWSQPEIVCYCANTVQGCSYPDLIEQDGRYFISSTQKSAAGVQEIDKTLLEGLWQQQENRTVADRGLVLSLAASRMPRDRVQAPQLPNLADRRGFSLDLWLKLTDLSPGQTMLDSRDAGGCGIVVQTAADSSLRLEISDRAASAGWDCDPHLLKPNTLHHVVFIVDGGPKVISVVVDGLLCDGGEESNRKFGYGRFTQTQYQDKFTDQPAKRAPEIGDVTGGADLKVSPAVRYLRIYDRSLRTSEAIGNFRAGCP